MKKVLSLFVVLALASSAQAVVIQVVGSNGDLMNIIAVSTPAVTMAGAPVDVWDVDLVAISPATVNDEVWAYDGTIFGDPPGSPTLYQVKAFGALPTPTLTNAAFLSALQSGYDTHFDQLDTDIVIGRLPTEDQTIPLGMFLGHMEGSGTFLDGAWSRSAIAGMQSPLQLAQVVVSAGGGFWLTGAAADGVDTTWPLNHLIPEPATMVLLVLGGFGLIRRRR